MKMLGILWNTMKNFKNEAIEDISQYATIDEILEVDLEDYYEMFIKYIYIADDTAEWKVNMKIDSMIKNYENRDITILFLDIDTSERVFHERKHREVFKNLEEMKFNVRDKYSKKVDYYFFDNVFHGTDNEDEYMKCLECIKKFSEDMIENDDFNQSDSEDFEATIMTLFQIVSEKIEETTKMQSSEDNSRESEGVECDDGEEDELEG